MYVQRAWIIRSGHVSCYQNREQQHLRRDDHRRQEIAVLEGMVQNDHQGGGQRHTGQVNVS